MRANYRRRGRAIPIKTWANRLGYKSPRSLGMLVEGKRLPSTEMIELLAKDYGLSAAEKRYFELLVLEKSGKSSSLSAGIKRELENLRAGANQNIRRLTIAETEQVFQWHILVIRQLVGTRGFKEDYDWIHRRLRGKVSLSEIKMALQILLSLGGLVRNPSTGRLEKTQINIFGRDDVPNAALRKHHAHMMERAKESLTEQGVYEREMISYVFSFKRSDLPKLKQVLRDLRANLDQQFHTSDGDSVFQLNLHLFEHTAMAEPESE